MKFTVRCGRSWRPPKCQGDCDGSGQPIYFFLVAVLLLDHCEWPNIRVQVNYLSAAEM